MCKKHKKAKKLFKQLFGTKKNISFKLSLSLFSASIIFLCLSLLFQTNTTICFIFEIAFTLSILLCFLLIAVNKNAKNFIFETIRFTLFFVFFILSFAFITHILSFNGFFLYFGSLFSCTGVIYCSVYLICKFSDIYNFFKKIFMYIKFKLYDTTEPPTSKVRAFIENITALLASIIALSVTVQTIADTIINLFHSLK